MQDDKPQARDYSKHSVHLDVSQVDEEQPSPDPSAIINTQDKETNPSTTLTQLQHTRQLLEAITTTPLNKTTMSRQKDSNGSNKKSNGSS